MGRSGGAETGCAASPPILQCRRETIRRIFRLAPKGACRLGASPVPNLALLADHVIPARTIDDVAVADEIVIERLIPASEPMRAAPAGDRVFRINPHASRANGFPCEERAEPAQNHFRN